MTADDTVQKLAEVIENAHYGALDADGTIHTAYENQARAVLDSGLVVTVPEMRGIHRSAYKIALADAAHDVEIMRGFDESDRHLIRQRLLDKARRGQSAVDGEDELREQVSRAIASAWYNTGNPTVTDAVMAVVRPLLAARDAAVERAEQLERRAANAAAQIHYMTTEIAKAIGLDADTPAGTVQSVRTLKTMADLGYEWKAERDAAQKRLDQVRAFLTARTKSTDDMVRLTAVSALLILDAAPADETEVSDA